MPSENTMEFEEASKKQYDEMSQEYPVKFAWVRQEKDTYVAQHWWVKCRDFLQDALLFSKLKEDLSIYKFKIDDDFVETNLLALKFPKTKHIDYLITNLVFLNSVEDLNNISHTELVYINKLEKTIVIKLSDYWKNSPTLLSFYTFYLKILSYTEDASFNNVPATEASYILTTEYILPKFMANLKNLTFPSILDTWESCKKDMQAFHDRTGFVSVLRNRSVHPVKIQLVAL
jgi:hypothetical protein